MKHPKKIFTAGFTLPELIVSVAIIVMITGLILVNYRKFDSNIVLTDLAYDIGLSIRNAQIYGLSVRGQNSSFTNRYGIHFETATPNNYVVFVDSSIQDSKYITSDESEKVEGFKLQGGFSVKRLCANDTTCATGNATVLDISFVRPNPDATILTNNGTANTATIVIGASDQNERKIIVRSTGQISIQK